MFMVRLGAIAISDPSLQGTAFYRGHAMEGGPLSPPQRHVMSSNGVHACAVLVTMMLVIIIAIIIMMMMMITTAMSLSAAFHLRMP